MATGRYGYGSAHISLGRVPLSYDTGTIVRLCIARSPTLTSGHSG